MTQTILQTIRQAWKLDPKVSIADFAKENYRLPAGGPVSGRFDVEYTPYLKKILECLQLDNKEYEEIVFMKGAQVGATSAGLCLLNWIVGSGLSTNVLAVYPTERVCSRFVKKKFRPMIVNTPKLVERLNNRSIDRDSLELFSFPGGSVSFGNAGAANTLRMDSCQYILLDEVSDFPMDTGGQGDPVEIARARAAAFEGRKKIYLCSTPTEEKSCRITRGYNSPDVHRHKFFIPCPHCNTFQTIEFKRLRWSSDLKEIHLECLECHGKIEEHHKTKFLALGEWREVSPRTPSKKIGFHLSALYSPLGMLSWKSVATQFLAAKDDPTLLKVFTNNILGEAWKSSISISKKKIKALISDYEIDGEETAPQLPRGVCLITAGVDFGENFTCIEIVGWGKNSRSWGLEYIRIEKHISSPELWEAVDQKLKKIYRHHNQTKLRIACSVLDTGYQADKVYEFVCKNMGSGRNIIGVKGVAGFGKPIISTQPHNKKSKAKIPLYFVSNHTSNETLFSWLNVRKKEDAGRCFFPKNYEKTEYFSELTAVRKITETSKGSMLGRWVQDPNKRCEANDCRRYAIAGLWHLTHLGVDLDAQHKKLQELAK